jgi:copper chaperone CopZ
LGSGNGFGNGQLFVIQLQALVQLGRDTLYGAMNTFAISGMTCANCARKVEATLKAISPRANVTLEPPRAMVETGISVDALNDALGKIGKYRVSAESFAGNNWMMSFMAGFFIVFGAFKLLDVPNFANAFAQYDVIAKVFKPWGYVYPFIEIAIGFAFLFYYQMTPVTWISLVISVIGAVGVIQAYLSKQTIQCACLGTVFKLPMSVVTIIENVGMAAMSAWMLVSM